MNIFMISTLHTWSVLKKAVRLCLTGFVNNLWDKVPGEFKKIKAFKSMLRHYRTKHEGQELPPDEGKRKHQESAMVWTNTMGVVTKETALRRSKRVQKARVL